jgi:hypothetical protein
LLIVGGRHGGGRPGDEIIYLDGDISSNDNVWKVSKDVKLIIPDRENPVVLYVPDTFLAC